MDATSKQRATVVEIVGANRRRKKNGKSNFSGGACRLQVGRWTTCAATCKREATRPFDHLVARARHMRPSIPPSFSTTVSFRSLLATLLFHASTTTASARIIEMERPRSPLRISRHAHAPLSVTAHLKINPRTRNPVLRISGTDSSSRFERTFRRRYSLFHRERNGKSRIYWFEERAILFGKIFQRAFRQRKRDTRMERGGSAEKRKGEL